MSYKCYEKQLPFVSFVFMDVKSPSKLNEQYRSFVRVLREQLSSSSDVAETVEEIKNAWVNGFFGHSDTTENVAQMIMSSVKEKGSAEFYLDKLKAVNELSAKDLLAMSINLPSLPEQQEIVRILDTVLEKETRAKEAAEQVLDQIALLKKSILARAFRGEL